jgi:hypothetical protein
VKPGSLLRATPVARIALVTAVAMLPAVAVSAQVKHYALQSSSGLRMNNVVAAPATLEGKRGVKLVVSDSTRRSVASLPVEQQQFETFAVIEGTDFGNGVIEAEVAGEPAPGAGVGARGFVGIAFRVQPDLRTYDALYLRPTNGRADDQMRRNHSVQYISHPDWPWERLRRETPERYESYVDLVPGKWTPIRIVVHGDTARLFVHDQAQPTLIVNDVKSGATAHGAIALWIGPGTIAHFRNLRIQPGGPALSGRGK